LAQLFDDWLRTAAVVLWCLGWALVAYVSLQPQPPLGVDLDDKLAHFLAYGLMSASAVTFCRSFPSLLGIAAFAAVVGVLMEYLQALVPGRLFEVADMVANAAGAGLGWVAAALLLGLVIRPRRRALA